MRIISTINFFCYLCIIFLIACTSPKFLLDENKTSANQLLDFVNSEQNKINSFEASSRISVDSEEFSGNFFAKVLYLKEDSLLITVSGPFGTSGGALFIGKNRFIFYNQYSNQFYTGSVHEFMDKKFFQFPLKLSELINIFLGREILKSMQILDFKIKNDMFFIQAQNGPFVNEIWIDNSSGHIRKLVALQENQISYIKEYGDYVKSKDIIFPKKISMTRPVEKQAVSIYYTHIALNKTIDKEKFRIKVSDKAKQIGFSKH